jgi:hypothetical protein
LNIPASPEQAIVYPKTLTVTSAFPVKEVGLSGVLTTVILTTETDPAYFPYGN